ncbi:MAG: hypothetical protein IKE66_01680 [Hyphomicrobium sp.]|nr:hypothetical protein [Hyphomicrobium sp.]
MATKTKETVQQGDKPSDQSQKGGLSQEESGGPGSREKRKNQEKDGQLEQGRQNDLDD